MECVELFDDRAIVDLDRRDVGLLLVALVEVMALIENDGVYVERVGYEERIGYAEHSLQYLSSWLIAYRRDPKWKPSEVETVKILPAADLADKLLVKYISGGSRDTLIRVSLTADAFKLFDAAIREMLEYFGADVPAFWGFSTITGHDPEDFLEIKHQISEILAAIAPVG